MAAWQELIKFTLLAEIGGPEPVPRAALVVMMAEGLEDTLRYLLLTAPNVKQSIFMKRMIPELELCVAFRSIRYGGNGHKPAGCFVRRKHTGAS